MGAAADPSLTVGSDGADDGLGDKVWAQNPALVPGSSTALPSAPVSTQARLRPTPLAEQSICGPPRYSRALKLDSGDKFDVPDIGEFELKSM